LERFFIRLPLGNEISAHHKPVELSLNIEPSRFARRFATLDYL
jgi:hypothetical protein